MNQLLDRLLKTNCNDSRRNFLHEQLKALSEWTGFPSGIVTLIGDSHKIITSLNMTDTQAEGICDLIKRSGFSKTVTYINETLPPPWGEISKFHFRSSITFPLVVGNNKEGYISLLSPKKHSISDEDENQLKVISRILSQGYLCNKSYISDNSVSLSDSISQTFIRQLKTGFISYDTDGGILQINPALLRILGSPSAKDTKKINLFTFPALVESGVTDTFKRVIKTGEPAFGTHNYESKWGKYSYFHLNTTPVRDDNGIIIGGQGWVHDITELVQNSSVLTAINRSSDILQRSRNIRESINDVCNTVFPSLDVDCMLIMESKSPRSFELFKIVGSACCEGANIPIATETFETSDLGLDSSEVAHLLEGESLKRDGSESKNAQIDWITSSRAHVTPIFSDGKPFGLILLFNFKGMKLWRSVLSEQMKVLSRCIGYTFSLHGKDRMKTKTLNATDKQSRNDYREIMDTSPFAILLCDRNGQINEMNETALELLVDFSDVAQDRFSRLPLGIHDVLVETLSDVSEKVIHSHTVMTPDGDRKHLRFHIKPTGEDRILLVIEDSTESKESSRLLSEEIKRTEISNRAKSEFLANMSHEIRTPLNALLGFSQLMSAERLSPKAREHLLSIQSACESLEYLTSDLLDVTKIEAGQLSVYPAPNSLRQTVDESIMMMRSRLRGKDVELLVDFVDDNDILHIFDKARVKQVLVNLISNAIKFTEKGQIVVSCRIDHMDEEADEIVLSVDDTGIGIPTSMRESIFSVFTQINSSVSKKHGGTGLGLSIVRGIVNSMDGQITVVDKEEPGARFEVHLTLERAKRGKLRGAIAVRDNLYKRVAEPLINIGFDVRVGGLGTADIAIIESNIAEVQRLRMINPYLCVVCIGDSGSGEGWIGIPKDFSVNELRKAVESVLMSSPVDEKDHAELDGMSVLVIEDNPLNIKLIEEILRGFGCKVTVEDTGAGGVKKATKGGFDICLMDVQMPDVSGLDATMQIRYFEEKNHTSHLPIIALTAYASVADRERCLTAGMDGYVAKPIKIDELISIMKTSTHKKNVSLLERLSEQLLISPSKLKVILSDYVKSSLDGIEDIKEHIASNDFKSASEVCHKLKGMAYFEPLLSKVIKLGGMIKEHKSSSIMEIVSDLECEFNRLGEEIKKESSSPS